MHKGSNQSHGQELLNVIPGCENTSQMAGLIDVASNADKVLKIANNPTIQKVGGIFALGLVVYAIASVFDDD